MSYARNRSSSSQPIAEINITPLVDVLLTVLIIFMVSAPLLIKNIPFPLGSGHQNTSQDPVVLGLTIRETGEWLLEGQPTSRFALDQSLRVISATGAPIQLDINPEAHSSYDNLASVLAIANDNKITNLRVVSPSNRD